MDDQEAVELVDAAWDAGIRAFDVAPHYGLGLA
jgi:D-threo-aldose 1-dehydrogenase